MADFLLTHRSATQAVAGGFVRTLADYWLVARMNAALAGVDPSTIPDPVTAVPVEPAAPVWVSMGRWVASCPYEGCGGVTMAEPGWPFMCPACLNGAVGRTWRAVQWPERAADIEEVLVRRPIPATRNWLPGETVDRLMSENRLAGLVS